jgi:hypothetical protein
MKRSLNGDGRASMFPDNWSVADRVEEIAYARYKLTMDDYVAPNSNSWTHPSSDGKVNIEMYIGPQNTTLTVVPPLTTQYRSAFPIKLVE